MVSYRARRYVSLLACATLSACAPAPGSPREAEVLRISLALCESESCPDAKHGDLLHQVAYGFFLEKDYAKAEFYGTQAVAYRTKAFGRYSAAVATSLDNLGLVYSEEGRHKESCDAHAEACAIYKSSNAAPLDQGICSNNLAWELESLGKLSEAEQQYLEAQRLFDEGRLSKDDARYQTLLRNLESCRALQRKAAH